MAVISSPRFQRHVALAGLALTIAIILFIAFGFSPERWGDETSALKADGIEWRLSMTLAYTALIFLGITLLIGPVRVIRGKPLSANQMQRRDVGIWAGLLALAHMVIGMQIHTHDLQLWYLFFTEIPTVTNPFPIRISRFGLANYLGLFQASLFTLLLLISSNIALRRLGTRRWKNIQRLSYVAFASVVAHGLTYQSIEHRGRVITVMFVMIVVTVIGMQLLGAIMIKRRSRVNARYDTPLND